MEKAIHITNLDNLKYYDKTYNRIYFGAEFCQNLIPTEKDLETLLDFAEKRDLDFTFVTPFVTYKGISRLKGLFELLKRKQRFCEVVINDWGVLELLTAKYRSFRLSLGRLLTRQNRDPAMAHVLEKQLPYGFRGKDGKIRVFVHVPPGERYQRGIKSSFASAPSVQKFLAGFGIERVELNNLAQGLDLADMKFKVSLYMPFVNISTTRFCPMKTRLQKIYRIDVCKRECQKEYAELRTKHLRKVLYKRGNTTFYKNPVNPRSITNPAIDRIVYQPELPF